MKTYSPYKKDFPVLLRTQEGTPLTYLDNGATTQKPTSVINTLREFYTNEYATIHRGVYQLSQDATARFDHTRSVIRHFINAQHTEEIIFTSGTTQAINLVARSYAGHLIPKGKTILVTQMEHHANFVPWQQIAKEKDLNFKVAPILQNGELDIKEFEKMITPDVAVVAFNHVSNTLGTINPIKKMIQLSKKYGAITLVDGAQAISHIPIDVQALDCDFYCFSSHKCYGPTGVGVLYGKKDLLQKMPPYQFGGDMVEEVSNTDTTFAELPEKFEAGTPAIAEIIALADAITYIQKVGHDTIQTIENALLNEATEKLSTIPGLTIYGTAAQKVAIISFTLADIHPHDIGTFLDNDNVAIRAGHHCTQPLMKFYKIPATARASFAFYNSSDDIDRLIDAIHKTRKYLL